MVIEQIYTGCLAQGAYYIESEGEVVIIDPLREVQPYIDRAATSNAKIKYILETHFHADFVSGHVTLAEKTGAAIVYGPNAQTGFESHIATDGEILKVGAISIKVLHTPGHTMESTTYLLRDATGKDIAIFSGDTLFLGDVGRPDLAQKANDITQEDLAGILYESLRNKIMPLSDHITVYPAHGAGSACGKNMMKETVDTLGNQKKMNYALRADMTKAEFIKEVTDGLMPPPAYFPLNVKMNKEGYESIDKIIDIGKHAYSPDEFELIANGTGAIVLDVRHQDQYAASHIPRSIFIGLNGSFAPWVGELIQDVKQEILLVVEPEKLEEAIIRLSRVGFDQIIGYLDGGVEAWTNAGKEVDHVISIKPGVLVNDDSPLVDVRKESEHQSEHVRNSINVPLSNIVGRLSEIPQNEPFNIHCAGGYRSMIAASILKSKGYHNFKDVTGGFGLMKKEELDMTEFVCPSTL